MKYLKPELYEKVCYSENSEYYDKWNEMYQTSLTELEKISSRLPKLFLKEFNKYHFHDNTMLSLSIQRVNYHYVLKMELLDSHDKKIIHNLVFTDVRNFKSNMDLGVSWEDWIYCEILPVDEKRTSLEVEFPDDTVYFEFSRMHYKKTKLSDAKE